MGNPSARGEKIFFRIKTPLNVEIRTTVDYWDYIINIKHPVMEGKEGDSIWKK